MAQSLKESAISGAIWKMIERVSKQAVQFCIGIVLARLLCPSDYGVIGMLSIFFALADTFQDSGFGTALVQKQSPSQADYSTVFYCNVITSVTIYLIFFCAAPYIADFYKTPILKDVTRVASLSFILSGLTGVIYTRMYISLRFKLLSIMSITGLIITGTSGIIMAYNGWGVWSLVFQGLISSAITGTAIWIISGWRPSLIFSKQSFKSLFNFGGKILASRTINTVYNNLYTLVIGRTFNPAMVGHFNRANTYAQLPTNTVLDMAIGVNFPILAKISDDNEKLLRAYSKLMRVPLYVLYPILIGIAVVAKPLIIVMIGEKWLPCVPMLQILCIGSMFIPLTHMNLNLLYVKGRSDLVLKLEFIKKPIAFAILFASIPFGIIWMVAGRALYSIIGFFLNCYYTGKLLHYGAIKQMRELGSIYAGSLLMGCAAYCSMSLVTSNYAKLAVAIPTGIAVYLAFSIVTRNQSFLEVTDIIRNKLGRR